MRTKKWLKRMLAFGLMVGMFFTNVLGQVNTFSTVQAASAYENTNLLVNPAFDTVPTTLNIPTGPDIIPKLILPVIK